MIINNQFLDTLLLDDRVLNIYVFGSHLYECNRPDSDIDLIVVTTNDYGQDGETITDGNCDFSIYSDDSWKLKCENMHINALEVISTQKEEFILKETKRFLVNMDLIKLRESISATVSNSWAKANKKLNVEKDYNPHIAKKSLWHCFRILMYGIQYAKYRTIINFQEANNLYNEIVLNECSDWKFYKNKYQERLNNMRTEFRSYMAKEWIEYKKVN